MTAPSAASTPPLHAALVIRVAEGRCEVLVDGGTTACRFAPGFPTPHVERVAPGHAVAIATGADGEPVVLWRWYDAVVIGHEAGGLLRLWEPAHGEVLARPRHADAEQLRGGRAYASAGLPGADWWVESPVAAGVGSIELDAVATLYTEHGLWPAASPRTPHSWTSRRSSARSTS